LCKECHDSDAQAIEKGGQPKQTIGVDRWPVIFDLKKKKKKQIWVAIPAGGIGNSEGLINPEGRGFA
jgi:hypothetical protein